MNFFYIYQSIIYRKDYRFDAVECQNPYDVSINEWKELMSNNKSLKWIVINSLPLYDQTKEIPSFNDYQQLVLNRTLDYAKVLNVNKIHLVMMDTNDDSDR
jgi:hydroxypyruvate isomerase